MPSRSIGRTGEQGGGRCRVRSEAVGKGRGTRTGRTLGAEARATKLGDAAMIENIARRRFLKGTAAGAAGFAAFSTLPLWSGRAAGAETVQAITWGGYYADALKKITT